MSPRSTSTYASVSSSNEGTKHGMRAVQSTDLAGSPRAADETERARRSTIWAAAIRSVGRRVSLRLLALPLVVFAIGAIPYPLYVTEPCVVLPRQRIEVRAQIAGLLSEILVNEGAHVHAGTVLARLDG